jgi:alpha-beta hydrolase superfamily lysophospholipase
MDIDDVNWSSERDGSLFWLPVCGRRLAGCHWRPASPPGFVVLFFHGLCSSVEYHANFLRVVPGRGGAALAVDHVGNGHSGGARGSQTVDDIVA